MTATPSDLKLKRREQELHVTWPDGPAVVFPAAMLRAECPCATCRTEREERSTQLLPILKQATSEKIELTGAQLVGNYAVQLIWSDGHSTGIFDFRFLRELSDRDAD